MKKILHLFSDPSHSALWSRYLRMLTLIALFAFGSHGVWGLGIKRNVSMTNISLPTTDSKGTFENKVYTWSDGSNNLIQLKDLDNTDLSEYESIVIPVSNWTSGTLRCLIRVNDNGTEKDFTCSWSDTNSASTPLLFKLKFLNASFKDKNENVITKEQLKNVKSVSFGGSYSTSGNSGSATIGQIYLTKQLDWDENGQITILPQDINCDGRVTKNGSSFTFTQKYATVTIDFIGDGISAKKLASASSSENNPGFNIFYCIDDNYINDKSSTSELGESNVKKVKYAYQNEGSTTITIKNFVLEYKDPITVTLKAENGTINGQTEKTIKYCETPITLPAATPNIQEKVFNAWRYNDAHVGNAGDKYTPTENITLTAHYTNKTLYYNNELGNCLGDYTKTVPTNTVFTPNYSISNGTQKEFTFNCNRPQLEALNAFWYGWIFWAKPSSATENVNDKPFYFWTNAQDTRFATDANTGIWDNSISSDIKISRDGKLYVMTEDERNKYLTDMMHDAKVSVKVAYFDNTIRMYAVIKSSDGARTYVQAYEYKGKEAYINNAASIDVYFSVDHAYLTNFIDNAAVDLVTATGNKDSQSTGDGTVKIYTLEGYDIHNPAKVGKDESVVFEAIPDAKSKFTKWGASGETKNPRIVKMDQSRDPSATFVTKGLETITVDNNIRKYGIYVPDGVKNAATGTIPVIISLHGRDGNVNPVSGESPNFNSIANTNNIIVVYPQGRHGEGQYTGFETGWNKGFEKTTGWEATGKENGDTRFIEELVKEIKTKYPQADPKRFYLCGFSMGGMMTYACAKVLNGTFAAYGSCSGFPLNEFHMNLATPNPIPFIHLHGNNDGLLGIKHLNKIIENLLFRNGCDLSNVSLDKDWSESSLNGEKHKFKKYDFTGVNDVPVTTVTFDGLGHWVEASAPAYLWKFFSDKTVGQYDSDIEWKWDMTTINKSIANSQNGSNVNDFTYGWKHIINGEDRSLTYGGEGNTMCTMTTGCSSANPDCKGNHNVYNSIQLTAGKHTLYAQMESTTGTSSVTLRNILTGAETVARKVVDNSGTTQATTYNVLYEFEVGEGAEFSLELKRSDTNSACTLLEIHKGSFRPKDITDQSQDNASIDLNDGKLAELTFEGGETGVDIYPITDELTQDNSANFPSSDNGNMKLYLKSRLGIKDGKIDNKAKYIVEDRVFGHYFQNIPDADIYDRYGASDYMRVVLGEKKSLSGHDGIDGIQTTGKVTIGFWVNGNIAVNRGLAYDEPSMFYIAGDKYYSENEKDKDNNDVRNPHMFNIKCNGGVTGYMNMNDGAGAFEYHSGDGNFGGLCDTKSKEGFYNRNFYKDCNWHYITYQMYDNLSRYNMYVDGEPTCLGGYATHNAGALDSYIAGLNSIVLGGANARNVTFAYDVAFAYDDIVIYNRVLSKREINKIIEKKNYSPSVWHFDRNLENNIFCNRDLLDKNTNMWASSDGVYTLKSDFTSAAALTYDGITEIPAFKGLRFVTNGNQKIQIDAKSGALHLSQGVKVVFSNLVKDTYVRMEYKEKVDWNVKDLTNVSVFGDLPSPSQGCVRTYFKFNGTTSGENSITMPSNIDIIRIENTAKSFAQIKFVDKNNTNNVVSVVKNPKDGNEDSFPRLDLYVNAVERLNPHTDNTTYNFKFTSSSPHVASIDSISGKVTLHGIAGSTVITAELVNDENKYDCDIYDQYAFEPSNRIFSSYEIVVDPKEGTFYKVADGETYTVGQTLYNGDNTVGVTLGGWTYNNGNYYEKTDLYSDKETWAGQKFEKNPNRIGYLENSRKTEEDVFQEFFSGKETFSTNGSYAAKSEQLKVDANNTYAATGNYSAPTDNKSAANATPWLLPCRGSHIKIEPTDAGLISVYVMQEGCVSHVPSNQPSDQPVIIDGVTYAPDEPIDVTVKKVYVADEKGEIVEQVVADTKSKVAAQMWKDDGRARAEYFWGKPELAYNQATMKSFDKINDFNIKWSFLDNWPNPGMQQHVFKLGTDKYGHAIITKGIVRYTFNVLPGKTYYIFSNTAKLGLAGFTFEKGKHAKYEEVMPDAKHKEWRATGDDLETIPTVEVKLEDGIDYSAPTDAKNANVKLNRTFYKNSWNAICLPYSINRRQIEDQFGDGTMVVLMNNINTSTKKVMFIEHANQDIIAGYPYLIFPTTKEDKDKTDHSEINGIKTRATFGEADSPLFSVGTDGNTYLAELMQSDALVFKGTFTNTTLNEGSYVVTNKGVLSRIPKDRMKIKPYRSYIYFNRQTAGAKAILLQDMNVNGFENDEDNTTGIENLLFESGILTHSADVYSIDGQLVRSKVNNLNGLPKGVYIVNGKKYVKK